MVGVTVVHVSVGQVTAAYRYPLKGARGEQLTEAGVDRSGVRGDRTWACLDAGDGTIGSGKDPRRWGRLLEVGATLREPVDGGQPALELRVAGSTVVAGTGEADAALTALLGRPVTVTSSPPPRPRLHRLLPEEPGLVPEWLAGAAPGAELVTDVPGPGLGRGFRDFGAVHLVTTGELDRLAGRLGSAVRVEGFRPNLVLDAARDPAPGALLRLGDVLLRVQLPTPRCVVPALTADGGTDRDLLRVLARDYRVGLPGRGRAACFGVYAEVVEPGTVRVGEPATVTPG